MTDLTLTEIDKLRAELKALHDDLRKLADELHRLFDLLGIRLPENEMEPRR